MTICCIFLLLLLLYHGCRVLSLPKSENLAAPRINGTDGHVLVGLGSNLTLVCEGDSDLYWHHEADENYVDINSLDYVENYTDKYPFISTLTVREAVEDDRGFFICSYDATVLSSGLQASVYVDVQEDVRSHQDHTITTPKLFPWKNQHFVVGYNFTLKCIVRTSHPIHFKWILPPSVYNKINIMNQSSDNQISLLEVRNATLDDSGNYTCVVNNFTDTRHVRVLERLAPYINLTQMVEVNTFTPHESSKIEHYFDLQVFPPDPKIVLRNWNRSEVQQTDRVNVTFIPERAKLLLKFLNTSAEDYGNYTLEVATNDGAVNNTFRFLMNVSSKPRLVSKGNTSRTVKSESVIQETCDMLGFPLPDITWDFRPCQLGVDNCLDKWHYPEQLGAKVETHSSGPGNLMRSTLLSFKPNVSGVLRCFARNVHGSAESTFLLRLSDIDEEFVFCHEQENRCASITNQTKIQLDEGQPFVVRCAGMKFAYQKVSLLGAKDPNWIIEASTEFSFVKEIRRKTVTIEDTATYTCVAITRAGHTQMAPIVHLSVVPAGWSLTVLGKLTISLACGGIVILIIVVFRLYKRVKKEKEFRKSFRQNELYLFQKGNISQLNRDCTADEQAELLPYDQKWEVAHEDIQICKQLGSGAFGRVVEALVKGLEDPKSQTLVAIKMCKNQADPSQVRALAIELKIMIHLGKHLNIVNLMGANTLNIGRGELWILLEYCRHGNLLSFMHQHRQCFINQIDPITDNIDPMMLVPDADGIVYPMSASASYRRSTSQAARTERTLSISTSPMKLASPPRRAERASNSTTDNTPSAATTITQPRQQVQNPLYCFVGHLSHKASEDNKIVSVPLYEASEDNKIVSVPLYEASEDNMIVSVPHEASEDNKLVRTSHEASDDKSVSVPHEASEDNVTVSVPNEASEDNVTVSVPNEASEDSRMVSLPPHEGSEDNNCSGGTQRELDNDYDNMKVDSTTTSELQIMNTDSTAFSSSQMSSSTQPSSPSGGDGDNGYLRNPFECVIGEVPGVSAPFTTSDLVNWAWQVAQGMNYLASRKVLHGDLAARNLLLADHNIVKISDFGLSRDMYKKDIYMKQGSDLMPIKWLSVEAIRDRCFSVQSDVWAFGITLWELFTLGSIPYPGIEIDKDFLQLLENGHKMEKPKYANHNIYDLMLKCWELKPRDRPSFSAASSFLGDLMHSRLRTEYTSLNDPYRRMNEERFKVETDFLAMLASPDIDNIRPSHPTRTHYINIQQSASDGTRDKNNIVLKPPEAVTYSSTVSAASPQFQPSSSGNDENYLPMSSSCGSPNSKYIFSPLPNTESRFTFDIDELEASPAKNDMLIV